MMCGSCVCVGFMSYPDSYLIYRVPHRLPWIGWGVSLDKDRSGICSTLIITLYRVPHHPPQIGWGVIELIETDQGYALP